VAAAILLGGGGLAHPQFFVVGAAILGIGAAWSAWRDRAWSWTSDAGRTLAAVGGGAAIVAAGLVASLGGPPRLDGDTSKDAFLRRVERWGALRRTYRSRFEDNWRRYAPIMSSALVVMGTLQGRGFARRFLVTWIAVTLVALPVGILTAWFPPDRILTFAFCIPLLAALGFVWLGRHLGRWWIAWPVGVVVWLLMILAPFRVWAETSAFVSAAEMRHAVVAGRIAATTPPGTVLVFVANDPSSESLFLASHTLNVARAAVPPDRAGDVAVFVGSTGDLLDGRPTERGSPLFDLASATSLGDLPRDRPIEVFVVSELDRDPADLEDPRLVRWSEHVATTVERAPGLAAAEGEPLGISIGATFAATLAVLLLLAVAGGGWAWWVGGDLPSILLIAPAFGVSTLTAGSLLLERLGVEVGSRLGGLLVVAATAGAGYLLALRRQRHRREEHRRRQLVLESEPEEHP
jgi:hypothetical protein